MSDSLTEYMRYRRDRVVQIKCRVPESMREAYKEKLLSDKDRTSQEVLVRLIDRYIRGKVKL